MADLDVEERVARAIAAARAEERFGSVPWEHESDSWRQDNINIARAAIAELNSYRTGISAGLDAALVKELAHPPRDIARGD